MEESRKIAYEPPMLEVFVVKSEGIICATGVVPGMEHGWDLDF